MCTPATRLYQVKRASDGSDLNIGLESAGGVVSSAPQVSFCSGTTCTITELYDQTSNGNNMPISPGTACSGCSGGIADPGPGGSDIGSPAMALPVTVDGQPAYGALFDAQGTGYRIDNANNVPAGSQPEGVYMMTSSNITRTTAAGTSTISPSPRLRRKVLRAAWMSRVHRRCAAPLYDFCLR